MIEKHKISADCQVNSTRSQLTGKCVCQLQLVSIASRGDNIPLSKGHDFGFSGTVVVHNIFELDLGIDL